MQPQRLTQESPSVATASIVARSRRAWAGALMTLQGVLALAGCGGGGGDAADASPPSASVPAPSTAVQADASRTAKSRVGPTGGSVSVTAADGRRYTLTVPAGALKDETEISAMPVTSMGAAPLAAGVKGAVRFGPSGLKFGQAATLRIEGASNSAASGKRLLGFLRSDDGAAMNLMPVAVVGGALELPVPHFSDGGVSEGGDAELAAIPLVPIVDPAQDMRETLVREMSSNNNAEADAALLVRLHDQKLLPLLNQAANVSNDRTQDEFRESVVATWHVWQLAVSILSNGETISRLGDRVAQARARAAGVLLGQVDLGRADCLAPAPLDLLQLRGLWRALWAQKVAQLHGLDAADLGLDASTVARRMNDCARVAFVPRPLPTMEVGRAVSLNAQAELIFAAAPNVEAPIEFEFTVSSNDAAIANAQGFSDLQRQYTTVVTPRHANPVFEVRACLVTYMANGAPVASAMCERQTLQPGSRQPQDVVLRGTLTDTVSTLLESATQTTVVEITVRHQSSGPSQIIELVQARGTYSASGSAITSCSEGGTTRTLRLSSNTSANIIAGSMRGVMSDRLALGFSTGPATHTTEEPVSTNSCTVRSVVSNFSSIIVGPSGGYSAFATAVDANQLVTALEVRVPDGSTGGTRVVGVLTR